MNMSGPLLLAFFLVFIRCSALLLTSPVFGAQSTPVHVRIMTTLAISAAITMVVKPDMGHVPTDLYSLTMAIAQEVAAGILIGTFMSLALQVAQIAGGIMDLQTGLGSSHALNPINGVDSTLLSQFKFMLGVVVFLSIDGHHLVLQAMVRSYSTMPVLSVESIPVIREGLLTLFTSVFLLAIQIAAPVLGVSLVVDTTLGLISRAVPTFQAMHVGLPAKIALGLIAVGVGLPALTGGITAATHLALKALAPILHV